MLEPVHPGPGLIKDLAIPFGTEFSDESSYYCGCRKRLGLVFSVGWL